MSKAQFPGYEDDGGDDFDPAEFRDELRETYSSHMKSRQALDAKGIPPEEWNGNDQRRHYDGRDMISHFGMTPFWKVIRRAERQSRESEDDRTFAEFPSAFLHLVLHMSPWERREVASGDPSEDLLKRMPRERRKVLEWFAADPKNRMKRKRDGATEVLLHGEQGSTKTTALLYLAAVMMQINNEDIFWTASLDATEWITMAPYVCVCLPAGVDVDVTAVPPHPDADKVGIELDDVCRDVVRYTDPTDLLETISDRTPGQFYAIYPDPEFRKCEAITGLSYHPLKSVDDVTAATDLWHWIFALMERRLHGPEHNRFVTIMADELHKFMHRKASKDDHDSWTKIAEWGSAYGDGRKMGMSAFFATHKRHEVHPMALDKLRWTATMNGEDFPEPAPVDGNTNDQYLGQGTFWNNMEWAPIQWPDMKSVYKTEAEIHVNFADWEAMLNEKSA